MTPDTLVVVDEEHTFPLAEVRLALHNFESRFRQWNGSIDLLAMANQVTECEFRRYLTMVRAYRARLRGRK